MLYLSRELGDRSPCLRDLIESGVPAQTIVRIAADAWSADDLRTVVQNAALPTSARWDATLVVV